MKLHKCIDLSVLPKRGKNIDWINSIGYNVYFEYDNVKNYIKIVEYDKVSGILKLKYDECLYDMHVTLFKAVSFGYILGRISKNYRIEIGDKFKDVKRDIVIIDRKRTRDSNGHNWKMYKCKCNNCGYDEFWIEESQLVRGGGCPCCCTPAKTVVKGINDIATTEPWMIEYFVNPEDAYKYTRGSDAKVSVKCPDCGRVKKTKSKIHSLLYKKSIGCSCGNSMSYPNKFMYNILEQLGCDFINEYSASWSNKKRYDFYIPSKNLIIEMDGGFHYIDNKMNNTTKEEMLKTDEWKTNVAIDNGLDLIRVNCDYSKEINKFEFIKYSVTFSDLNEVFDLDKVDWDKVEEFATGNFVKTVCNYYEHNKKEMNMKDISEKFKIHVRTVWSYVKRGSELGWCEYKPRNIIKGS